jgi:uncharacterized repeat protein (TIGR03803 family)
MFVKVNRFFRVGKGRKFIAVSFCVSAISVCPALAGVATTLTTLFNFNGTNGDLAESGLIMDNGGNLYGTTFYGGAAAGSAGYGTVFELSGPTHQNFTTLVNFNSSTGAQPSGELTLDPDGNLYGVTGGPAGGGSVFQLSGPTHQTLSTLVRFNGTNSAAPVAAVIEDASGNLYGTTQLGGASGDGTVFELAGPSHTTLSTLVTFTSGYNSGSGNGGIPTAGLTADPAGNLYGATRQGGTHGDGEIFELSGASHQNFRVLASLTSANQAPFGAVAFDAQGNLYCSSNEGGTDGTVFELSGPNFQNLTTLLNFNGSNGSGPEGGLLVDAAGNLFGTTYGGGLYGDGTVYELGGVGHQTLTTLLNFNGADGMTPVQGLTADSAGDLFGTATYGGTYSDGVAFELSGTGFVVPEPSSLAMLAFGCITLLRRRTIGRGKVQ